MVDSLSRMLKTYAMVRPGEKVICALSGGADSVALLFGLYLLREPLGIVLEAAHFNHGLRGEESDRDQAFVQQLCQRLEIPLHLGHGQVVTGKKGLEAAAREARYGFFEGLSGKIATAHTADDNAETVLMHLVRGTGLRGLGAIAPVRGRYIRPLLMTTRQQVLEFLRGYHLDFVSDSTNETDDYLRNRLRHHVIPLLRAENPRFSTAVSAMALELREDEKALHQPLPPGGELPVDWVRQLEPARQSRVLAAFLERWGVQEPEREHIVLARRLVYAQSPSAAGDFPGGVRLQRCYGRLVCRQQPECFAPVELAVPGVTPVPQLGLEVVCTPAVAEENGPGVFTVEPRGTLVLRPRQPGDTITLPGGTKSLKKLFIDRKLPAAQRGRIPVVCDEQGVLGVYGIGVNQSRKGTSVTIQIKEAEAMP